MSFDPRKIGATANQGFGSSPLLLVLQSPKRNGGPMASKTTLNAKNLEALGVERLAQLLIEISSGDAAAKRKLRVALAGATSPKEASREIAKRLVSIARARSFINWKNRKALVKDLDTQRRAIIEQIALYDPDEALSLLWQFTALAKGIFERCDDSSGTVIEVFHQACADLGDVARLAAPSPRALAERVVEALQQNDYGQYDGLIAIIAPALGPEGMVILKELVEELGRRPVPLPPKSEWVAVGWGTGGTTYAHEVDERHRQTTVSMALKEIADVQGDVDAFIAQYDPAARKAPNVAAAIAERLLLAGRAGDALGFIERAEVGKYRWIPWEWQDVRMDVLEALDRKEEAQAFRWTCFQRELSTDYLRAYLKRLPDFDDIDAEERALDHAAAHPDLQRVLGFFLDWPALDRAARLLIDRRDEINGNTYELLAPAAEALSKRYPLAATLALRAMIDFTLNEARSKRYGYAADHLGTCAELASRIEDYGSVESHAAYVARLRREHAKKSGFWPRVDG